MLPQGHRGAVVMDMVTTIFGGLIAAVAAGLLYEYVKDVGDEDKRQDHADEVRRSAMFEARYHERLKKGLIFIEGVMGERLLFSLRGPGVCLTLAFVYASLFFLIGWAVSGVGKVGDLEVMKVDWPATARWAILAGIVALVSVGLGNRAIDAWFRDRIRDWGLGEKAAEAVYRGVGGTAGVAAFLGISVWVRGLEGLHLGHGFFVLWVLGVAWGNGAVAFAVAVAFAGAGAGAGAIWLLNEWGLDQGTLSILLFWLLLPLLNSLLDWLSWAVSRGLGRNLRRRQRIGGWTLVWHGFADAVAAVLFLGILAFVIAAAIQGFVHSVEVTFDLRAAIDQARDNPTGAGLWIGMMLASTLLPTLLHLGMVFAGVFTLPGFFGWRKSVQKILDSTGVVTAGRRLNAALYLVLRPVFAVSGAALVGVMMVTLGFMLWAAITAGGDASVAVQLHRLAVWGIEFADWAFGVK